MSTTTANTKHVSFFDQMSKNKRDSVILVFLILGVLYSFVYIIAQVYDPGLSFVLLSFSIIITLMHTTISYYKGADIVLKSTKAIPADPKKYLHYHNVAEGLAIAAGIQKPKLYILPSPEINAFASGRDPKHAVIAVTEGALQKLDRQELEGVIAHEMSHIGNYDIRFSMLVAVFVGLVAILSEMFMYSMWFGGGSRDNDRQGNILLIVAGILLAIIAPIVVRMVQLAISRKREYLADATGAKLTRYPEGLASALEKIKKYNEGNMKVSEAVSHMFLSDPKKSFMDNIFATHPPVDERIRLLRAM